MRDWDTMGPNDWLAKYPYEQFMAFYRAYISGRLRGQLLWIPTRAMGEAYNTYWTFGRPLTVTQLQQHAILVDPLRPDITWTTMVKPILYAGAAFAVYELIKYLHDWLFTIPPAPEGPVPSLLVSEFFEHTATWSVEVKGTDPQFQTGPGAGIPGAGGITVSLRTPKLGDPASALIRIGCNTPTMDHLTVAFLFSGMGSPHITTVMARLAIEGDPRSQLSGIIDDVKSYGMQHTLISDTMPLYLPAIPSDSLTDPTPKPIAWDYSISSGRYGQAIVLGSLHDVQNIPVRHLDPPYTVNTSLDIYVHTLGGPSEQFAISWVMVWNSGHKIPYVETEFGIVPITLEE